MKVKFISVTSTIPDNEIIFAYDKHTLNNLRETGIEVEEVSLHEFSNDSFELAGWQHYDKVIVCCNSETASLIRDICESMSNVELWVTKWPKHQDSNNQRYKIFSTIPEMVAIARNLHLGSSR